MTGVLPLSVTASATFVATNIDDLVVLTTLFATSRRGGPSRGQVVLGQYLGIAALVAVSAVVAVGLLVVPDRWVGLLGLIPIGLGTKGLVEARRSRARRRPDEEAAGPFEAPVRGLLGVAGLTIANGADNISVYTPLFRQAGPGGFAVYAVVFVVLVAVWCIASALLAGRRPVTALLDKAGHWLVPVVFIVIGVTIVATSGLVHL